MDAITVHGIGTLEHRRIVYDLLRGADSNSTGDEIAEVLGWDQNLANSALYDLERAKLAHRTGEKRPTRLRNDAYVYAAGPGRRRRIAARKRGTLPWAIKGMHPAMLRVIRRSPGITSREVAKRSGEFTHLVLPQLLYLTRTGRVTREKRGGLFRYTVAA